MPFRSSGQKDSRRFLGKNSKKRFISMMRCVTIQITTQSKNKEVLKNEEITFFRVVFCFGVSGSPHIKGRSGIDGFGKL